MEFHGISDDFKGCYPMDTENMIVGIIDETCVFFVEKSEGISLRINGIPRNCGMQGMNSDFWKPTTMGVVGI